jgi:hypothetical protein
MQLEKYIMWESVECPEVKRVRRVCFAILLCTLGLIVLSILYPSVHALINTPLAWIAEIGVCLFAAVMALKARAVQKQYNDKPWEHGGHQIDFSEK